MKKFDLEKFKAENNLIVKVDLEHQKKLNDKYIRHTKKVSEKDPQK